MWEHLLCSHNGCTHVAHSLHLRSLCEVHLLVNSWLFCSICLWCSHAIIMHVSLPLALRALCKGHLSVNSSLTILIKHSIPSYRLPSSSLSQLLVSSIPITIICLTTCCFLVSHLSSDWNVCFVKASCTLFTAKTTAARILSCHRVCDESIFVKWKNISSFHDWVITYGIFQVGEQKVYYLISIVPCLINGHKKHKFLESQEFISEQDDPEHFNKVNQGYPRD